MTPPDTTFDLHLPAGTATLFDQRVALIPEARRNSWRYHPVVAGDTLASVAQEYRVPAAELGRRQPARQRATASPASRPWWCRCRRPPSLLARHPALHRPPGRYAGYHCGSLRRLAEPVAALECDPLGHPGGSQAGGCAWPSPRPSARQPAHRRRTSAGGQGLARAISPRQGDRLRVDGPSTAHRQSRKPARSAPKKSHSQRHKDRLGSQERRAQVDSQIERHVQGLAVRKTAANPIPRLCFACISGQAKATIACASKTVLSALRNCET